ncbi:MAG TPA: SRPBCC family protein [Pseudonocardiaceae bacterium]|nr:SRPBCC family protein [Pseudonocardiaceae bacterium]
MNRFTMITPIAAAPARVFDVSLLVEVHTESMGRSGERAVGGVTSGPLKLGDTVTWEARHFGLRWRLTSRITAYESPVEFVDEQISGPFLKWHHTHRFEPDGRGGTLMHDIVEFAAPLGPLGRIAELAVLNRYMARLIRIRNDYVKSAVEAAD